MVGRSAIAISCALVSTLARAQGTIEGTVYDSLRGAPLAGALVVADGTVWSARTDAGGHFELDSLPAGRYALSVESDALDSLGVSVPSVVVEMGEGAQRTVRLGVPSIATLWALACRGARVEGDGLLIGVVRDAASLAPLPGATVEARWNDWSVQDNRVVRSRARVTAVAGRDGAYVVCGVPVGSGVAARASLAERSSGVVESHVGESGLGRRDLLVGAPGEGVVTGTVATAANAPLEGARLEIAGDSMVAMSGERGTFHLERVSSGSQMLVARRVGFAEGRQRVELRPGTPVAVTITLTPVAQLLDPVTVVGHAGAEATTAAGFATRRQRGLGYFLDVQAIDAKGSVPVPELLRGIPGFDVRFQGAGTIAVWVRSTTRCTPLYYLDGMEVEESMTGHSNEVEGVEVYAPGQAPPRYGGAHANCAVVLLWTRRPTTAASHAPAADSSTHPP